MINQELDKLYDSAFSKVKNIAIVALVVIIIILLANHCQSNKDWETKLSLKEAVYLDSLKTWKDKDGANHAKINLLEADNIKDFLTIKSQKEDIIRLQALVKENKNNLGEHGSATVLTTEGKFSTTTGKPNITFNNPTVSDKPCDTIYPNYQSPFGDKWVNGNVFASKDSIKVDLKYKDMFDLVIGEEKTGFLNLGKAVPYADVKSYNPYTEVKEYRTYRVKAAPPKKFGIGPVAAYGFGTSSLTPQFFIGIGGSFNLIRF